MKKISILVLLTSLLITACKKAIDTNATTIESSNTSLSNTDILANKTLVFSTLGKNFTVVDAQSGNVLIDDESLRSTLLLVAKTPVFTDSLMILPCGNLMAGYNYRTKKYIWQISLQDSLDRGNYYKNSELCMSNNTAYVIYLDYKKTDFNRTILYAVDIFTGDIKWQVDLLSLSPDLDIVSNPTATNENVFVPVRNKLYAFDAQTGSIKWQVTPGGKGITYNPAYDSSNVYVAFDKDYNQPGYLLAYDKISGALRWKQPISSLSTNPTPVILNNKVLINYNMEDDSYRGGIQCFDAATGAFVWKFERTGTQYYPGITSCFVDNSNVYATEVGQVFLYGINGTTGTQLWTSKASNIAGYSSNQNEGPLAYNNVYIKTTNAFLKAFTEVNGTETFNTNIGLDHYSNPDYGFVLRTPAGKFLYASESGMQQ